MNKIPKRESDSYVCEACRKTFYFSPESDWSEKDALEEYKKDHPDTQHHPAARVCDNCHKKIKAWLATLSPRQKEEMRKKYEKEFLN